jgi:coproporphyrinogen III oxidase
MPDKAAITTWFQSLQDQICHSLEALDGQSRFQEDKWDREQGGGGRTRLIQNGKLITKGGVNFSAVHGPTPDNILHALKLDKAEFYATGVSIVLHPVNPWMPIIHMNVRYFEMTNGVYWFGGGIDLTPHYIDISLAKNFHQQLKSTCDAHDAEYYPKFKQWADEYFYLKHRKETRGVGGIFFDRLAADGHKSKEQIWAFVKSVGETFIPAYTEQTNAMRDKPFGEKETNWQMLRRGRYVEFNLVWDKGTKFGLDTDGRTESILMSLPPTANWAYDHQPEKDSLEAMTLVHLKKDINWIAQ